ncbi:SDR family oxidoreductase [Elioraea sp.]|uniref:SDR family oxidoreductase n=1 Tax=Elioraea sp. TaxID=2185103 RepID=UPI0025C6B910|nr:SDR family oxidoreductase [Elioraea sp.]
MQAGAREYPAPPFPRQELDKPGLEGEQLLAPMYDAPYYKGSGKLAGKRAIITGGDSGIGRAVAVLFAREGADVAILHLEAEHPDADVTRAAVLDEGQRCIAIAGDVTDRRSCFDAADRVAEEWGGIDILVNNAAFQLHASRFEDLTEEHFDLTVRTNLYGYFHMTQACLRHMRPGATIVNTGSVTGIDGSAAIIDYSMTKGGIHAFTRALSGDLLVRGIRVNAVAPGPVWTPLNPSDDADKARHFGAKTPMRRPAQPEELAPAYVFLASAQMSSYITGEILPVVGGYAE